MPKDIDVILVAPKGSGRTVRSLFREGRGINSSFAVYQDVTGKAEEKAQALGVAVGSGYLYKTTFEKEVYSDLYGERGCLMGGIHGMFLAQYEVLRERGHSPSEAFNETVEEATQSLYPLIGANGMDWMYEACSTTARRGAIDWTPRFKDALKPVFNQLYDSVKDGSETKRSLEYNSQKDYRQKFEKEMEEIRGLEIWRAGKAVRYVSFPLSLFFSLNDSCPNTRTQGPCARRTRNKCNGNIWRIPRKVSFSYHDNPGALYVRSRLTSGVPPRENKMQKREANIKGQNEDGESGRRKRKWEWGRPVCSALVCSRNSIVSLLPALDLGGQTVRVVS